MLPLGCRVFMLVSLQHGSTPVVWDLKRNKHPEPYFYNKSVAEAEDAIALHSSIHPSSAAYPI